jgi:homoserine dehydrogenase
MLADDASRLQPLRLTHIVNRRPGEKRVDWVGPDVVWTDDIDAALGADVDVVIELLGGEEPARSWIGRALAAGKDVVTANKLVMAQHGPELLAMARKCQRQLAYGASVAGGVPVISALREGLVADRLLGISGILNGTCNYILTRMEEAGCGFAEAMGEAQGAGYAEADPSSDVDGLDARAKLVILSRIALGAEVTPEEAGCRSIRAVSAIDFHYAHELRSTIRQISYAAVKEDGLHITVQPMLVHRSSPYASVQGAQNLVIATGKYGGETTFSGNGAGGGPTAVAVVSDLLRIARGGRVGTGNRGARRLAVSGDIVAPHYLRFMVRDRPGILASLTSILAEHQINVDAVLQEPGFPKEALPFVITVERCSQATLEQALERLRHFDFLVEAPLCLPRLEPA